MLRSLWARLCVTVEHELGPLTRPFPQLECAVPSAPGVGAAEIPILLAVPKRKVKDGFESDMGYSLLGCFQFTESASGHCLDCAARGIRKTGSSSKEYSEL